MPHFTNTLPNLVNVGPICEVMVMPPSLMYQAMGSGSAQPPAPTSVKVIAMVDTGASGTVITPAIAQQLGLQPVGVTSMSTPSTSQPVPANQYNVDLAFQSGVGVSNVLVMEAPLAGQHIQCLIGRDVLQHGVLVYIGHANQFTLSF